MKIRLMKRKRHPYSKEVLQKALEEMRSGMAINIASRKFNIPRSTLHAKLINRYPTNKPGPDPVLNADEEEDLVMWIHYMCSIGHIISRDHLIDSVALFVKKFEKPNLFTNGRPGRHWVEGFFRRHDGLKQKIRDNNLRVSREKLSLNNLKKWFTILKASLKDEGLSDVESTRVFGIGEIVIPFKLQNKTEEDVTILVTGNAAGQLGPTITVFDSKCLKAPKNSDNYQNSLREKFICTSEKGLMNSELFYNYIEQYFYPWLLKNKIELPVTLFVDEHVSYFTQMLNEFCSEKKIALIALPSDASNFMQPLKVDFIPILRRNLEKHLKESNGIGKHHFNKNNFGLLLQKSLENINITKILRNSFQECGLHPLPMKEMDYDNLFKKYHPRKKRNQNDMIDQHSPERISLLESIEKYIDTSKLDIFRSAVNNSNWTGDVKDTSLFNVWKKILIDTYVKNKNDIVDNIENFSLNKLEDEKDHNFVVVNPHDLFQDSDFESI